MAALNTSVTQEINAIIQGVSGQFVEPGLSGAPTRGRLDTLPTGGHIAQAFALMGIKPVWAEGSQRVIEFEILSNELLGGPRVNVTLRVSGFFRDAFPNVMKLYDAAIQALANYDETPEINSIRAHIEQQTEILIADGMSAEDANRQASYRVFGSKPGAYGAGLQGLIDERCWENRDDLAETYLNWGGYYQFQGGMTNAVTSLSGQAPAVYHNDHFDPERPKVRTLKKELNRVIRSRLLNPKWIEGMREHRYKGAFEMAASVIICLLMMRRLT